MMIRKAFEVATGFSASWHRRSQMIVLQLLLLSIASHCTIAGPVSNPEISSNSNKVVNSASQQQGTHKGSSQDSQLNSLNAYAAANGYDGLTEVNFKPSYKLPDMETNFTPMQGAVSVTGSGPLPSPTPVIMQYLPPQSLNEGSVQYLQLIPTRPLIVPISPYLSAQQGSPYQQALTAENTIADYANRPSPVLAHIPANNVGPSASPHLVNMPTSQLPYGLHTYANAIQPYRTGFRINREIKEKNLPPGLTLNLHEYFPGTHDMPHHLFMRGRP